MTRQSRQPSSRVLALTASGVNVLVCGAVATTLALLGRETPERPRVAASSSPQPVLETSFDVPSTTLSPSTPSVADPPAGYRPVTGPGGMTTHVPVTWPSARMEDNPDAMQADEPAATSRFVRYGGYRASASMFHDRRIVEENRLAAKYENFVRLRLDVAEVRGMPAIDWEFQFDKDGVRRHARGVYWIAQDHEYFVYASAPAPRWQQTRPIFDIMREHSTP